MSNSKSAVEYEFEITNLNFFDFVESETQSKNPVPRPNDEQEGVSGSKEGGMHQPITESGHSGNDAHLHQPGDNTQSEGNLFPRLKVLVFQNVPETQT
ncbi:hypothetical protein Tco_0745808 [Tanacetum coccineum]